MPPVTEADVFTPRVTPHDRSRLILRLAAAMLTLVVIAWGVLWIFSNSPYVSDRPFDTEAWANAHPISDDTRWRMRDDLRENFLRPGMSLEDVEALLGQGESGTITMTYPLRNRTYLDPQYDRLAIAFDGDDRLVSTSIESARGD